MRICNSSGSETTPSPDAGSRVSRPSPKPPAWRGSARWTGARTACVATCSSPFGLREGLASPRVHAIFEDREGVLWFGTDSGLTKRAPSAFLTYADEDGVPD